MSDTAADPPVADEGESAGGDLTTHSPDGAGPDADPITESTPGRIRRAWRVLRGRDIKYMRVADPAKTLENKRLRQANRFRSVYAPTLLLIMAVQIAFADYFFWRYSVEVDWELAPSVVIAFLSSVVVEVIGAVIVVTRALFAPAAAAEQ